MCVPLLAFKQCFCRDFRLNSAALLESKQWHMTFSTSHPECFTHGRKPIPIADDHRRAPRPRATWLGGVCDGRGRVCRQYGGRAIRNRGDRFADLPIHGRFQQSPECALAIRRRDVALGTIHTPCAACRNMACERYTRSSPETASRASRTSRGITNRPGSGERGQTIEVVGCIWPMRRYLLYCVRSYCKSTDSSSST